MITTITNDYYGYSVACDGNWAAVSNPSSLRYEYASSSYLRTGSIEVYKYNINTDIHDKKTLLTRHLSPYEYIYLITEQNNINPQGPNYILQTELTGSRPLTANKNLIIDWSAYYTSSEDGYGYSIDLNGTYLAVGCPYFTSTASVQNSETSSFYFTGSGQVDIYDLSRLDIDPYANRLPVSITGYTTSSGIINVVAYVPPYQQYSQVLLESRDTTDITNPWISINIVITSNDGGTITIPTIYSTSLYPYEIRVTGIVGTDPYLMTIETPSTSVVESFGYAVSINNEWLSIGSPSESGSKGLVYMYRKTLGAMASWSLFQTLVTPSEINTGDNFGKSICLNKATGSYSASMVVGTARPSGSKAYVYEFNGYNWANSYTLLPDNTTIYPLTFYNTFPIISGSTNTADSFGISVSIYKDTIMVGAPTDRYIYEYSGSSVFRQGSVYFFERCPDVGKGFYLARKSYGNEKILDNNALGTSVGVYNNYAIAGSPKIDSELATICYLRGSLFQSNYCGQTEEVSVDGQFVLWQQATGSFIPDTSNKDWQITNIYQVKKKILQPYRDYGFSCDISDSFIMIGAPLLISGSSRIMDLASNTGSFTGNLDQIGDLTGKTYIYNLKNLRENFYVGNVFYRNGKLVIMSSGSAFDGLLLVNADNNDYEYDLNFKSKQVIYEKQIVCAVDVGEFNVSTNPTAILLPTSSFDINNNGIFDFQDCDVLLKYMKYKSTEALGPSTDWSSSIINTATDEEASVYNMYNSQWPNGSGALFTSSYSYINNNLYIDLDFNQDNKIDINDMNILWKYFINRLTQKNYETYVTPNSRKKFLSQILDFLNDRTMRGVAPNINTNFLDYGRLSKADPTGSYLAPYISGVGLYSGTDLVAVGKLGSPIKNSGIFPLNIILKIDF